MTPGRSALAAPRSAACKAQASRSGERCRRPPRAGEAVSRQAHCQVVAGHQPRGGDETVGPTEMWCDFCRRPDALPGFPPDPARGRPGERTGLVARGLAHRVVGCRDRRPLLGHRFPIYFYSHSDISGDGTAHITAVDQLNDFGRPAVRWTAVADLTGDGCSGGTPPDIGWASYDLVTMSARYLLPRRVVMSRARSGWLSAGTASGPLSILALLRSELLLPPTGSPRRTLQHRVLCRRRRFQRGCQDEDQPKPRPPQLALELRAQHRASERVLPDRDSRGAVREAGG
jgi:hypothetical protein